ncbi:endoglucanase-like, partial [Bradysia coprophila]|uniref:endoglucanase-like n=1 Tax=Bradysia coprophila TaxID=38358 RepID=UPI00187DB44A
KSEAIVKLDQNAICGVISSVTIPNLESKFIAQALSESTTDFESSFWISDPAINSTIEKDVSQSGRSTRYWDCCKPSCSWNGKASVTSPVNSCNRDGFNVIDKNTRNGCENGGNAFTCTNNIPWAINDNLAYGFAAANIKGQSEADWCCQCYELTFTSGPVNGKKMIVQVTNTGGDLGENHFDLQMPGGGVGIFNGCSSQWGAPDGGWGDRYGGVHSLQECDQLPSQIRQGQVVQDGECN